MSDDVFLFKKEKFLQDISSGFFFYFMKLLIHEAITFVSFKINIRRKTFVRLSYSFSYRYYGEESDKRLQKADKKLSFYKLVTIKTFAKYIRYVFYIKIF